MWMSLPWEAWYASDGHMRRAPVPVTAVRPGVEEGATRRYSAWRVCARNFAPHGLLR